MSDRDTKPDAPALPDIDDLINTIVGKLGALPYLGIHREPDGEFNVVWQGSIASLDHQVYETTGHRSLRAALLAVVDALDAEAKPKKKRAKRRAPR